MRLSAPFIYAFGTILIFAGCGLIDFEEVQEDQLYERIPSTSSGIEFKNELTYTKELNPYTYRNFFNGGGVAVGDINNDGLIDIYLTGNQVPNKLYLNKGNFEFEDITDRAGVAVANSWSTGATMVDINGDERIDIYVTKSGSPGGENRHNELFINNGDLTFTEKSKEYGLDVTGLSTDAIFFDYDRDGDLDMYLLNNSFDALKQIDITKGLRETYDRNGGDKLFRNNLVDHRSREINQNSSQSDRHVTFEEVTKEAGLYSSKIGFGLDIAVSDLNNDDWPDIYISNDFFERDYLYLNNGDGSFTEILPQLMPSISLSSMGVDIADINNDGRTDIYVTDMLPKSDKRVKSKTDFDNWEQYHEKVDEGYHYQFVRNTLQLNNGRSQLTGKLREVPDSLQLNIFSEISRLTGVEATDWSWTTLIADFNNDSHNDIYVTNGILKDLTDQDYVNDRRNLEKIKAVVEDNKPVSILFNEMPSVPLSNYAFAGTDSLNFVDKTKSWGLDTPSFSNGAAYADLNNDGALDIIVNNVNNEVSIYRNQGNKKSSNSWLIIKLQGQSPNTSAIGSKVKLWTDGSLLFREQMPGRGFQSSVDHRIHFGLGEIQSIDSLLIKWPDGKTSFRKDIKPNQILEFSQNEADLLITQFGSNSKRTLFRNITESVSADFTHNENKYTDFQRNNLLFHKKSTQGPPVCTADINRDSMDDFYIGGAKGQAGRIFIQQPKNTFITKNDDLFDSEKDSEDTACTWFDANGNGLMDLYVASGSSELPASSTALLDRLYINSGDSWKRANQSLPSSSYGSTSVVKPVDFNQDGHTDLFTGIRLKPFAYGLPVDGNLLMNDGDGNFKNVTEEVAPGLLEAGLITDAEWFDYDSDGDQDLAVVGEWMPIKIFENKIEQNNNVTFEEVTSELGLEHTKGLWQSLSISDLDRDGHEDIIAGNIGANTRLKASDTYPLRMWVNDFDQNGSIEHIIAFTDDEGSYPYALRDDMIKQLPLLGNKFSSYASYADKTIDEILSEEALNNSVLRKVTTLKSAILWNDYNDGFKLQNLDEHAQFSSVFGIHILRKEDQNYLLLGGNLFGVKPEIGRYDASYGSVFQINSERKINYLEPADSGFELHGEVRGIYSLKSQTDTLILVTRNNDEPVWFKKR